MDMNEPDPRLTGGNPLPQNTDAEAAVLAAAILSSEVVPEIASMLVPDDFYRPAHRTVYAAIVELFRRDIPIDQLSLADYLERSGEIQLVGGKGVHHRPRQQLVCPGELAPARTHRQALLHAACHHCSLDGHHRPSL